MVYRPTAPKVPFIPRELAVKDLFPEYFYPSEDQHDALWKDPYIVFDTNILLNLYSYQAKTRERILSDLWKIRKRLWIPAQVAEEYLGKRIQKIEDQDSAYSKILDELKKMTAPLDQILGKKSLHPTLEKDAIRRSLDSAIDRVTKVVEAQEQKHSKKFIRDVESDPVLERLSDIFKDRVGRRWSTTEFLELAVEGENRYLHSVPPGFRDATKDLNKYGDLILWKQILEWSLTHDKPVIFVTDDSKADWWKLDKSKNASTPRRELIAEHYLITGKFMYAYKQEMFWKYSAINFHTKTDLESIKEIRRVEQATQEEELIAQEINPITHGGAGTFIPGVFVDTQGINPSSLGGGADSNMARILLGTQGINPSSLGGGAGSNMARILWGTQGINPSSLGSGAGSIFFPGAGVINPTTYRGPGSDFFAGFQGVNAFNNEGGISKSPSERESSEGAETETTPDEE